MQRTAPYFQPKTIMLPPSFGEASLLASVARESSGSGEKSLPTDSVASPQSTPDPIKLAAPAELPSTPNNHITATAPTSLFAYFFVFSSGIGSCSSTFLFCNRRTFLC
jgi:hypothetical protein